MLGESDMFNKDDVLNWECVGSQIQYMKGVELPGENDSK